MVLVCLKPNIIKQCPDSPENTAVNSKYICQSPPELISEVPYFKLETNSKHLLFFRLCIAFWHTNYLCRISNKKWWNVMWPLENTTRLCERTSISPISFFFFLVHCTDSIETNKYVPTSTHFLFIHTVVRRWSNSDAPPYNEYIYIFHDQYRRRNFTAH